MKKRVLAMILTLLLTVGLVPMAASAAVEVIDLTHASENTRGYGWHWNQSDKTLTLSGVEAASIEVPAGTRICHSGLNKVSGTIYAYGDLRVYGPGTLTAKGINAFDGDGDLKIANGDLRVGFLTGANVEIDSGVILAEDSSRFPLVKVYGTYTQKGGYLKLRNSGTGNGLEINGFGAKLSGGYLDVQAAAPEGRASGAIVCHGNEFVNEGAVVKAVNTAGGAAMNNVADSFAAISGVTILQSENGKAISGKCYAINGEMVLDTLNPASKLISEAGGYISNTTQLNSSEYVFCKMLAGDAEGQPESTTLVLDGLYHADDTCFEPKMIPMFGRPYSAFRVDSGSYAAVFGENASAIRLSTEKLIGSGTLVAEATGESYYGVEMLNRNTADCFEIGMTGTLVAISENSNALCCSSMNGNLKLKGGEVIAVSVKGSRGNCIRAFDGLELESCTLEAVHYGEGETLMILSLKSKNSQVTAYSEGSNVLHSGGMLNASLGYVNLEDTCFSAAAPKGSFAVFLRMSGIGNAPALTVNGLASEVTLVAEGTGLNENSGYFNNTIYTTPIFLGSGLSLMTSPGVNKGFTDATGAIGDSGSDIRVYAPIMYIGRWMPSLEEKAAEPQQPEDPQPSAPDPNDPTTWTMPFTDVPEDSYYYWATLWAYNTEPQITDGNGKDKFMPEQICTRGQVVTFLWRAAGCPEPASSKNPFTDVKSSDYFYKPVLWAVEQGITDGTAPDKFSPNNTCKNSHILTFIWRALGKPGDTGNAVWYQDAYDWANSHYMLEGTYTGTFDVNAPCPRKNVVQYLHMSNC